MNESVPDSWRPALEPALATPEVRALGGWLRLEEDAGKTIYPPRGQRLRALELTPLDKVRAVILGQDPYHGPGQAHGLAFSVPEGSKIPPSLANIYKEAGQAGSHAGRGWEAITDAVVSAAAERADPTVFVLWGAHAQKKARAIPALQARPHHVIESPHPSPLSAYRGFFGSQPFSRTNAFLREAGRSEIVWT